MVRELFAEHSCAVLSTSDPSSRPLSPLPKMIPAVVLLLLLLVEQAGESAMRVTELVLSVGIKGMFGRAQVRDRRREASGRHVGTGLRYTQKPLRLVLSRSHPAY